MQIKRDSQQLGNRHRSDIISDFELYPGLGTFSQKQMERNIDSVDFLQTRLSAVLERQACMSPLTALHRYKRNLSLSLSVIEMLTFSYMTSILWRRGDKCAEITFEFHVNAVQ
jgi:hypothetical protein